MIVKVGRKVAVRIDLASGTYDGPARVTRYEPPPAWLPGAAPVVRVRPKGFTRDVSVTLSDLTDAAESQQ